MEQVKSIEYELELLKSGRATRVYLSSSSIKHLSKCIDLSRFQGQDTLKQDIYHYSNETIDQLERTQAEFIKLNENIEDISTEIDIPMNEINKLKDQLNNLDTDRTEIIKKYNLTKTLELEKFASGNVRSISMNRKNLLASGSDDGTVFIWNTQTGVLVKELKQNKSCVTSLAFSHNNLLAAGFHDGRLLVWNTDTWKLVKNINNGMELVYEDWEEKWIESIAFSHDMTSISQYMASMSRKGVIRIWQYVKGYNNAMYWQKIKKIYEDCNEDGTHIAFGPNNLLAIGAGPEVIVWNINTWKRRELSYGVSLNGMSVHCVNFSHNNLLAIASHNHSFVYIYNIETWKLVHRLDTGLISENASNSNSVIHQIVFDKNDSLAIACSKNHNGSSQSIVRVFDTKTWNLVLEIESNYFETEEDNECFNETEYWPKLEVSVALNEKVLAIGFGKKVKVWQKETIPADKPRCIE